MPPRVWLPNIPLVLRLKAPPKVYPPVTMPPAGTEGTFKTKELVVETAPQITKPMIKNYLMAFYGMDINHIHSVVSMGRRRNMKTTMPRHGNDVKRFYIKLNDEVELPNVPKPIDVVKQANES